MSSSSSDESGSIEEETLTNSEVHRSTTHRRRKRKEKVQLRLLAARNKQALALKQGNDEVPATDVEEASGSVCGVSATKRNIDLEPVETEWHSSEQCNQQPESNINNPSDKDRILQNMTNTDGSSEELEDLNTTDHCSTQVFRLDYQENGGGGPPSDPDDDNGDFDQNDDDNDDDDSDHSAGNNYWNDFEDQDDVGDGNHAVDNDGGEPSDPEDNESSDTESDGDDDGGGVDRNLAFNPQRLNTICQLYTNHSVKEVLAIVIAMFDRYSWTYEALIGCFQMLNSILGANYFPRSKKIFWKALNRKGLGMKKYAYCKWCKRALGRYKDLEDRVQCPGRRCRRIFMKKDVPYFMQLDLKAQLSQFLARPDAAELLFSKHNRVRHNEDALEDIYDGSEYRRLENGNEPILGENDFSFSFNNDGFRTTTSSNVQVNPIYIRLNELPMNVRQKHLFLTGIWVDAGDPEMFLFLRQCLVRQGNRLSRHGITWNAPGKGVITSKFIPTVCTVDAKARCIIMNMMGPTGFFGCTFCPIEGVQANGVHFPFEDEMPQPRTDAQLRALMEAAHNNPAGEHQGVLGISALKLLRHYNLGTGMSTDDLHPLFEGVASFHTDKLLTENDNPYYIGAPVNIALINARLVSIKPPKLLARTPRGIDTRAKWRGHEWRNWILYYAYPCLTGLLPLRYLRHLLKLSRAIFLVSRDSVTEADLQEAEVLFTEYVRDFQEFFGVQCMRFNIHVLLHVVPTVRCWGPVFVHSTFNFESWNMKLKKQVKSMKDPILQIVNRHLISSFIASVPYDPVNFSPEIQLEVTSILTKSDLKTAVKVGQVYLLGSGEAGILSVEERMALEAVAIRDIQGFTRFKRALYKRLEIRSTDYRRSGKNNNSHLLTWNGAFLKVKSIGKITRANAPDICVLFANEVQLDDNANIVSHFASVALVQEQRLQVCLFENVRAFAIRIECAGLSLIVPMANSSEID